MVARGRLTVAAEIAEMTAGHLGSAGAGRLADVDEFRCVICHLDGNRARGDEASLVMLQYSDGSILRIAHARCSDSKVISVDGSVPSEPSGGVDVASLPVCMPGPDGEQLAVLFLDRSDASGFFTPGGGFVDPWFQELLNSGWELYQAPLEDLPAVVDGYRMLLDPPHHSGTITAPGGATLLDRLPADTFDRWFDLAQARGVVDVFAGALHLNRIRDDVSIDAVFELLDAARRRGEVAVGRLAVVTAAAGKRAAALQLAADLEHIVHTIRPGDGGPLDTRPPLVEFPVPPLLQVATFAGTPTLVLDLHDDDDDRARRTFKALQRAGLAVIVENRVWKVMPDGWGALLWPTQALVQTTAGDGEPRTVVFAEYEDRPAGLTWYGVAKTDPSMSVFLMITNLKGRPMGEQLIMNRIRRGRVLGGAMPALATI